MTSPYVIGAFYEYTEKVSPDWHTTDVPSTSWDEEEETALDFLEENDGIDERNGDASGTMTLHKAALNDIQFPYDDFLSISNEDELIKQ